MNKTLTLIVGILILGGVGWLVISRSNPTEQAIKQVQFERAPDFALQNYDGKTVTLSDFAGRPLIINSWAAWCPFCGEELVNFATVQEEFGDKVVIIAIDRAESRETAKKYTDELGVTDDLVFLLDPSDSFYRSISGFSMPETIFVDKDGNIAEHKRGPMEIQEIREKIQRLVVQ